MNIENITLDGEDAVNYFEKVGKKLTPEQEKNCFKLIADGKNVEYAETMIYLAYKRSISFFMHEFYSSMLSHVDMQEYYDACEDTLIRCIRNYDVNNGVTFITYVRAAMFYAINNVSKRHRAIRKQGEAGVMSLDEPTFCMISENEEEVGRMCDFVLDDEEAIKQDRENTQYSYEIVKKLLPERHFQLLQCNVNGTPCRELGIKLGVSGSWVGAQIKNAKNFIRDCYTKSRKIRELELQGKTLREISQILDLKYEHTKYYREMYDFIYNFGPVPEKPRGIWDPFIQDSPFDGMPNGGK